MDINLKGTFFLSQAVAEHMIDKKIKGHILNVSSASSLRPTSTEMLGRKETDEINHDISPIGRYATPQEIANLVLFMVSDMGNLIVGDTFYMTGGSGTVSLHR